MVGSGEHYACFWRSQHQLVTVNIGSRYELPEISGGKGISLRVRMWRPPRYLIATGVKSTEA